jgi:hypothetical protein
MPLKYWPIALLAFMCCFTIACQRDPETITKGPDPVIEFPTAKIVTSNIQGRVLDEYQKPLSGAVITHGDTYTRTDINGIFMLENVTANSNAVVLVIQRVGYFKSIRTLTTKDKSLQYVEISLQRQKVTATISNDGETINLPQGQLTFMPQQLLKPDNTPFQGLVEVSFAYIDPESPAFSSLMPGDLRGINQANVSTGLKSYGMMVVELEGKNSGEPLHLDPNKHVTMKMAIPPSLLKNAPTVMPLWYFDETSGFWKEEGSATKEGNYYIGAIKHFSFWNLDLPYPATNLAFTIQDQQGVAMPNLKITVSRKSDNAAIYAFTDNNGEFVGQIPANELLELRLENQCNTLVYKQDIRPLENNTALGIIKITPPPTATFLAINGSVRDCLGVPIKNGLVDIVVEGMHYIANIKNGIYKVTIPRCNNQITPIKLTATDAASGNFNTLRTDAGAGSITLQLNTCGTELSDQIIINLKGQKITFQSIIDSVDVYRYYYTDQFISLRTLSSRRNVNSDELQLSFFTGGDSKNNLFSAFKYTTRSPNNVYEGDSNLIKISTPVFTNDYITGDFKGTVLDNSNNELPVTGSFRIRRE